ncbi:hypothetical protein [Kitasatospora sp. NPDC094015]|uniref:hypothetical protein n=1 Tax=Kitasatospora sp. NPDC094015 TaxID=3155205 RepID=UPI0033211999
MAICTACGASSAGGARRCAACGRPWDDSAAAISEVVEVGGSGAYAGLGAAPGFVAPPATAARPPLGRWGRGVPYDPSAGRSALWGLLLTRDWLPALRALAPATAVLVLLPLLFAAPEDWVGGGFPFGDRYGAVLALTLAAFGGPLHSTSDGQAAYTFATDLRLLPMTVLVLWLIALRLGLGLRPARRGRGARDPRAGDPPALRPALVAAARVAVLAGAATALLGLLAGTTTGDAPALRPDDFGNGAPGGASPYGLTIGARETFGVSLGRSVAGTVLLAFLLAFAVLGAGAIRDLVRRRRALRGWALAVRVAARALAVPVGVASLAAAVLVPALDTGPVEPLWLLVVPNAGLVLLGFGSGAAVEGLTSFGGERSEGLRASLFDLQGHGGGWRWAVLLALVSAGALGWSAYRRGLGAADRTRLAVVHAALLTAATAVAGLSTDVAVRRSGRGSGVLAGQGIDLGGTTHTAVGPALAGVVVANLLWAALGALALPPLLGAVRPVGPVGPVLPVSPAPPVLPAPPVPPARPSAPPLVPAPAPAPESLPPAPAPAGAGVADPHEAYRRPAGA